jgi:hypothetical protein
MYVTHIYLSKGVFFSAWGQGTGTGTLLITISTHIYLIQGDFFSAWGPGTSTGPLRNYIYSKYRPAIISTNRFYFTSILKISYKHAGMDVDRFSDRENEGKEDEATKQMDKERVDKLLADEEEEEALRAAADTAATTAAASTNTPTIAATHFLNYYSGSASVYRELWTDSYHWSR